MNRKISLLIALLLILSSIVYVPDAYAQSVNAGQDNVNTELNAEEIDNSANYDGFLVVARNNVFIDDIDLIDRLAMESIENGVLGLATFGLTKNNIEKVVDGVYQVDNIEDAVKLYNRGLIASVEPNYYLSVQGKSDYKTNWWSTKAVGANSAWNHLDENGNNDMQGDNIIVGVIDSGVYREHTDFNIDNMLPSQNPANAEDAIDSNHGTFVAGVIAAQLNNGNNVDGIAPNVKIQPICVQSDGNIELSYIISGIDYCIKNNVDVINISIGGPNYMPTLEEACVKAEKAGIIVVVSAGNYKVGVEKSNKTYMYPASSEGVVSVSASAEKDGNIIPSDFTYYNDKVDFSAPGTDIRSLMRNGSFGTDSGTSYSSPLVAGMAALAKQKNKAINRDIFVEILKATSDDKGDEGKDDYFGYGHVNITKFVELLNKEYSIKYLEVDDSLVNVAGTNKYTISSEDVILPTPIKTDYDFIGWYDNNELLGEKIEKIPTASFGDKTFYAKWVKKQKVEIDSIDVEDKETGYYYKAVRTEGTDNFTLTMPANSVYSKDSIKVVGTLDNSTSTVTGHENTGVYTVEMSRYSTKNTYKLTITRSTASAPKATKEVIDGTATPKSFDGKTDVVNFSVDMSNAFSTSGSAISSYEIVSGDGTISENNITYSPNQIDAGKTLEIKVRAINDAGFRSKILTYRVKVGQIPVSNSVIRETNYAVNLNTNKNDLAFSIVNYNNKVTGVKLNGNAVQYEIIYNEASVTEKEVTSTLILRHNTIKGLSTGNYTLVIDFDRGNSVSVTIDLIEIKSSSGGAGGGASGGTGGGSGGGTGGSGSAGSTLPGQTEQENSQKESTTVIVKEDGVTVEEVITEEGINYNVSIDKLPAGESKIVNIPMQDLASGAVVIAIEADSTEKVIKKSTVTEEGVSLLLSEGCTIKVENRNINFVDVKDDNWAKASVDFVSSRELFKGVSDNEFGANKPMTRAMLFTTLARLEDVNTEGGATWYEKGMIWATESGVSDGSNPDKNITREQFVTMLYRLVGEPDTSGNIDNFTDSNKISDYAKKALAWAVEKGIINGNPDGTVNPQGNATRAQVAAMLERYIKQLLVSK